MEKWYTFTGRDCHSITFKANENSAYPKEYKAVINKILA